jgi:predicted ATP-grasp superfamily ATP-dependent carboligase
MRLFLYEYTCAVEGHSSLHVEGLAMLRAVVDDCARLPDTHIMTLLDRSLSLHIGHECRRISPEEEETAFRDLAARADWTVVIAPECDDILSTRCQWVDESGGHLLGPSVEAVRLTSDKLALSRLWAQRGITTPPTWKSATDATVPGPLVCKPRCGAGSQATFLIPQHDLISTTLARARTEMPGAEFILQPLVPGQPASVAFFCGPRATIPLVPALQRLSADGRFKYLGGEIPMADLLADRARNLAARAIGVVPGLRGYIGVDLILGAAADGSQDHAIEINPRLTTSYLGLRQLAQFNLAQALLQIGRGDDAPSTTWRHHKVSFSAAPAEST